MRRWIRQQVTKRTGADKLSWQKSFGTIGLKFDDVKEIAKGIQTEYDLKIPIKDLKKMKNCNDMFEYIKERR